MVFGYCFSGLIHSALTPWVTPQKASNRKRGTANDSVLPKHGFGILGTTGVELAPPIRTGFPEQAMVKRDGFLIYPNNGRGALNDNIAKHHKSRALRNRISSSFFSSIKLFPAALLLTNTITPAGSRSRGKSGRRTSRTCLFVRFLRVARLSNANPTTTVARDGG